MSKNNAITMHLLHNLEACSDGTKFFEEVFPHKIEVNRENLQKVINAGGLDFLCWLVDELASYSTTIEDSEEYGAWLDTPDNDVEGRITTFLALWDKYGEEFVGDNV